MTVENKHLYLAAEGGKLYRYDLSFDRLDLIFFDENEETLMALAIYGNYLYVGGKSRLLKFEIIEDEIKLIKTTNEINKIKFPFRIRKPDFHKMSIISEEILITATSYNQVWKFDLELDYKEAYSINPPFKFLPVWHKKNYNHINNIVRYRDRYYVCLNRLAEQYGSSGVAVLDTKMREEKRFEIGWEAHNFSFIDGKSYVLCGSSGAIKQVYHPHKAGLMSNKKLVFEHDSDSFFCKDFTSDGKNIYIVGGSVGKRQQRALGDGVIYILDEIHRLTGQKVFKQTGGFCGCLLNSESSV